MLWAILNKSWRQQPTKQQLYGHLPPITKTIKVRQTRYAGHCWRSRDELISDVLLWNPSHGPAKAGRPARTYIQQLCANMGCSPEDLPEAMNDRGSGKRGSGISVLVVQDNDDDKNQFHSNYKIDEHILKNLIQKNVLPTDSTKKVRLIIYYKFKTSNLIISNNTSSSTKLLDKTNIMYICLNVPWETVSPKK